MSKIKAPRTHFNLRPNSILYHLFAHRSREKFSPLLWKCRKQLKAEYTGTIQSFAKEYDLFGLPICTFPEIVRPSREPTDIALSIASLRLVDTENISYEQLLEFRNDNEAKEKLRRLRLFAYENYQGKSRSFIEDDLMARISDYESTVKKWGFETKSAVMTALMDSKLVGGGIAGSFFRLT